MNPQTRVQEFQKLFKLYEECATSNVIAVSGHFNALVKEFDYEYRQARRKRAPTTPHLNVLDVFGVSTRELRHSDALAWFLREDGEHEQGDLFMRALLEHLGMPFPTQFDDYTVEREKHSRVDIAAWSRGKFAIFIENKIRDTPERDRQFDDLTQSLRSFSKANRIPEEARRAVFLTDSGREPTTGRTQYNVKRLDLFVRFRDLLRRKPSEEKSVLLTHLLDSYIQGIQALAENYE